ncbi:MAG: transposase [Treponema sp.]|nr:transposase [Treponema sp.]
MPCIIGPITNKNRRSVWTNNRYNLWGRSGSASARRTRRDGAYETYTAEEAFTTAQKLEIHYTPKHSSWLNLADMELSAMTSHCHDRRIDTLEKLNREVQAWRYERNRKQKTVKWQLTAKDAHIKLHSLYPISLTLTTY